MKQIEYAFGGGPEFPDQPEKKRGENNPPAHNRFVAGRFDYGFFTVFLGAFLVAGFLT